MVGIMALGAALRVAAVLGNGRFWFDEIITWEIASHPLRDMWTYLAVENHPPLHYFIIHAWMRVFGQGEIAVKLSSVLAGLLGIWVTGIMGKRLFGPRTGLWAAGITALSTFHIFFSAEARMYPWLYLFGAISLWMWWEMTHKSDQKYRWYWLVSTVAALYTHLGGAFVLVVEGAWYVWLWWRERGVEGRDRAGGRDDYFHDRENNVFPTLRTRHALLLIGSAVLVWLPWIIIFLCEKAQTFNRNAWYFWVDLVEPLPIEATRRFFFFDSYGEFMDLFMWFFVIGVLLLAFGAIHKVGERYVWKWESGLAQSYGAIILLVPLIIGFLTHVSVIKIYTVASAGAYLLAAAGLAKVRFPCPIPSLLFPAAVAGLFFAHSVGIIMDVKPAWRDVGRYLQQREGEADAIIILSHAYQVALEHYYQGDMPVLPFYPLPDDTNGDTLLRAVRRNWYTILTDENIGELEMLTAGKQKIFLVVVGKFYKVERIGVEWFMARGWKLKRIERWNDFMINPEVYLLEAP